MSKCGCPLPGRDRENRAADCLNFRQSLGLMPMRIWAYCPCRCHLRVLPMSKCEMRCKCPGCGQPYSCDGEPPHECYVEQRQGFECTAEELREAVVEDITTRLKDWATWWRTCLDCGKNHVSVERIDTVLMAECPACSAMRAVRTAPAGAY